MQEHSSNLLPEDAFLGQFVGSMALESAFRNGLIDRLAAGGAMPGSRAGEILGAMLTSVGVLSDGALTPAFRAVLQDRRNILEQKLKFLRLAATDVAHGLDDLLSDLPAFMGQSETFALFRYDKAMSDDAAAISATQPWVDYVTALSQAEAPVLVPHLPLQDSRRLLEVGGNTGVIAAMALDLHPGLSAAVLDLPAVCAIGRDINPHPRLRFVAGDARQPQWPLVDEGAPDAILFKSVLHDWPLDKAMGMLDHAISHLAPGGRVIICERGAFREGPMPFWMTANVVFAPFYRPVQIYREAFAEKGLVNVTQADVEMDMTFHIVTGQKP